MCLFYLIHDESVTNRLHLFKLCGLLLCVFIRGFFAFFTCFVDGFFTADCQLTTDNFSYCQSPGRCAPGQLIWLMA